MPPVPAGTFRRLNLAAGYLLLLLTLPALLENAYEVYVGTLRAGPQMIGYVLAHADPSSAFVRLIRFSMFAAALFTLHLLLNLARIIAGREANGYERGLAWSFLGLCAHNFVVSLYPLWSPLFARAP